jgi:hypothetical protein
MDTGEGAPSPGIKQQEREAEHSPLFSSEVKIDGATPPFSTRLHGVVLN